MDKQSLIFTIDLTKSMQEYGRALGSAIPYIVAAMDLAHPMKIGVLVYRDYYQTRDVIEWLPPTSDTKTIVNFIKDQTDLIHTIEGTIGDWPEASKTAIHHLNNNVKNAIVIHFADAPPHLKSKKDYSQKKIKLMEEQALGRDFDWFSLTKAFKENNNIFYSIMPDIKVDPDARTAYYYLAKQTNGSLVVIQENANAKVIKTQILKLFFNLIDISSEQSCHESKKDFQIESDFFDDPSITINLKHIPSIIHARHECPDNAHESFKTLFQDDDVADIITMNPQFKFFWRHVCKTTSDDIKQDLIRQLQRISNKQISFWIDDSYAEIDRTNQYLEQKAASYLVYSGNPVRNHRAARRDILDMQLSCNIKTQKAITAMMAELTISKEPTKNSIPIVFNKDDTVFHAIPHLFKEHTMFSDRGALIIAAICYKLGNFLAKPAREFLLKHLENLDLNKPENYSIAFADFIKDIDILPEKYKKFFNVISNVGRISTTLKQSIEIESQLMPHNRPYNGEYVECENCHYEFPEPDIIDTICVFCKCYPDINISKHAANGRCLAFDIACIKCDAIYPRIRHAATKPVCPYCRDVDPIIDQKAARYITVPKTYNCNQCKRKFTSYNRANQNTVQCRLCKDHYPKTKTEIIIIQDLMPTKELFQGYFPANYYDAVKSYSPYKHKDTLFPEQPIEQKVKYFDEVQSAYNRKPKTIPCSLCYDEYLPANMKMCDCKTFMCTQCINNWYGINKPGQITAFANLTCPFCKHHPKFQVIKSLPIRDLIGRKQPIKTYDQNEYHAWCIKCYKIKTTNITKECGEIQQPNYTEFTCSDCIEVKETESKHCPTCNVPTEKISGCNHITCICGTHWCYQCNNAFTEDTIYDHMIATHGSMYGDEDNTDDDDYYDA